MLKVKGTEFLQNATRYDLNSTLPLNSSVSNVKEEQTEETVAESGEARKNRCFVSCHEAQIRVYRNRE